MYLINNKNTIHVTIRKIPRKIFQIINGNRKLWKRITIERLFSSMNMTKVFLNEYPENT